MTEEQIKAELDEIVEAAMNTVVADTADVEIWITVDEEGDHEVASNQSDAEELFADNTGGNRPRHTIKLSLTVPLPKVIEVAAALPEGPDGSYSIEIK
jgi:hypothetical protein